MVFPQTPLPLAVELSLDNTTWTDITADVRMDEQIQITRGRSDWGQQVDAGRCTFSLTDTDGKYSPRNPEGLYYGRIGRNTPVRVSVMTGASALWLPGSSLGFDSIATPDAAVLDILGDIDVRLDATLLNAYLSDTALGQGATDQLTELIGKFNYTGNQQSWAMYTQYGYLKFVWSQDGTSGTGYTATSTQKIPLTASGRIALRVTLDVNNGAGGWTLKFYTSDSLAGTWVQLGADVVFGATTSIFNSTALLQIGNGLTGASFTAPVGYVHAAEVRNGIGGTVVANPDFTIQTSGATSFTDGAGRTWTVGGNAQITNRKIRFVGEVASWTPTWDTGGFDVVTQVEATGVLRRLGQGAVPAKSPMFREFTSPYRTNIVAYWPMEDASEATTLASAFDGHPVMSFSGTVTPAAYSDWSASDPLPTVGTGSMQAIVPVYTATSYIFMRLFVAVPAAGVVSTQRLFSFTQTGTAKTWSLYVNTAGNLDLRAYAGDGTQILSTGFTTHAINGRQKSIGVELTQNGTGIDYKIFVYDIGFSTLTVPYATQTLGTLASNTVGRVTTVRFGEDGLMNSTAFGHLAVSDSNTGYAFTAGSLIGWNGETAASRVHRLGLEEHINAYSTAPGDEQMGVQARATVLELMRAAGEVDEGILAEQRDILGIRLVQRSSLYNQNPAVVLDYTGDDGLIAPLDPVDDDQSVTNDVTVQRDGGSSARVVQSTGALSTQAPPNGIGLYDTSYSLNLYSDSQTTTHAGWRLSLGTWDETRFPQVNVNLAGAPASIPTAVACAIGSRLQITNPPVWLPPDVIDLMVQGYNETLSQFTWNITFNCTPYGPYSVAEAGTSATAATTDEFAWTDTDGCVLSEALTTTETDVDVFTTSGPGWSTSVSDTPFDWRISGEVMTVTAPGTLLNTNPFYDTNVNNWTVENSTIARSTTFVNPHPRALGSLRVTPDGVNATGGAWADLTATDSILPGVQYMVSMWVYSPAGWSDLRPMARWYTNAGAFVSTSSTALAAVAAGVWTYQEAVVTAPATAGRVRVQARHGATPAASDIYYVWGVRITRITSSWMQDAFPRTAASSWGTADTGQLWTNSGGTAADYNVTTGYGATRLATANVSRRVFTDFLYGDVDVYTSITSSATATGGSLFGGPTARHIDSDNLYQARVEFTTANAVILSVRKRVATVETQLATFTTDITHVAGTFLRVRFQVIGSNLKAKIWRLTDAEPYLWQIETTDTDLTTSVFIGLRSISAAANTNVNPEIRYDNYEITNPQTFTVTRSRNGVTKALSAAADVRLADPAIVAL